jgi:hypothetical protein
VSISFDFLSGCSTGTRCYTTQKKMTFR